MKEQALKLADELDDVYSPPLQIASAMIRRLVERIEELEKRPAINKEDGLVCAKCYGSFKQNPLTKEEIEGAFYKKCWYYDEDEKFDYYGFAREIEERHGIK